MRSARGCARSPKSSGRPARSTSRTDRRRRSSDYLEDGMVERRDVIGGGLVAGLAAAFGGPAGEQAQRNPADDVAELKVADAIDRLRQSIEHQHESPEVTQIRAQQRTFLKSNQKFPDYIDVGIDVWERVYDWHVRTRQPLTIVRTNDG